MISNSPVFGPEYYAQGCGPIPYERNAHWLNFFSLIADEIVRSLRPATVFDAGCALGFLVEALWTRGVTARGADISEFAISRVRPDIAEYCTQASIAEPFPGGPYDLVTCIEVVEHMPADEARRAIENMTRAAGCVLFSSTPDDFLEPTHINVRPPIYWLRLFAEYGFSPDLAFDASFVAPHAMLLRRQAPGASEDALRLFCEVLRHRADRAAFLNRQTTVERLTEENKSLGAERQRTAQTVAELEARMGGLNQEYEALAGQLAEARRCIGESDAAAERVRAMLDSSETVRRETERSLLDSRRQLSELTQQLQQSGQRETEAAAAIASYAANLAHIAADRDGLRFHLEALYASPGGRFLERYRGWLQNNRWRSAWVDRLWEPGMKWMLQRAGLSKGVMAAPLSALVPAAVQPLSPQQPQYSLPAAVPPELGSDYETWWLATEPGIDGLRVQTELSNCFSYRPKISVLVPVYRVPPQVLREMVASVLSQTYGNWELCIAMACRDDEENGAYLRDIARREPRIRVTHLESNEGISGNSNRALHLVTGEFVALLDHDDRLAPPALFEVVRVLNQDPRLDFIYTDKDQVTEDGSRRVQPLFKPRWSPDLMLNANYLTHLSVMRTALVREVGGWRPETDGAQDWDLFLRVTRQNRGGVNHIPKVLYHWRQIATSVASGGLHAKPYAAAGQIRAVTDHLEALGLKGAVLTHENSNLRIEWPAAKDRVSVILLGGAGDQSSIDRASAIAKETDYPAFEILVPVSGAEAANAGPVRAVSVAADAGVTERIDAAVKAAQGSVLVFLDEAARPADSRWLREISGPVQLPGVGMVGARFHDPRTGALRHTGIVFTADGRFDYIFAGYPDHVFEQFGAASWYRNWSALSGACFAIGAGTWREIGGLSEPRLHSRPDLHLCLKLRIEKDCRLFYNPYARFTQDGDSWFETPAPGSPRGADLIRACFQEDGDPYFHPSLDCRSGRVYFRMPLRTDTAPAGTDYAADSRILVQWFDAPDERIQRSRTAASRPATGRLETIAWLVPDFSNPFYGGIHTILRFADAFFRRHGVKSHFCVLGRTLEPAVRRRISAAFPELAQSCEISILEDPANVRQLAPADAAVSTLWTTAYAALEYNQARRKFYLIQDDEALFYPAGSISALVEASYGFGFHGICNTPSLLNQYRARGGEGEYFEPCVDAEVFHDRDRPAHRDGPPYRLFCYARPGHPRNCFELVSAALRTLKQRFGDDLTIVTAGAEWDRKAYGLDGVVHHLGLLSYRVTGAVYRMCDAGLVMMMTRHPSYLPLELMACGALVVTNRNPDTAWLLRDEENCLLSAPTAVALADRVEAGLRDAALRRRVTAQAREQVERSFRNWDAATEKIYEYMRKLC